MNDGTDKSGHIIAAIIVATGTILAALITTCSNSSWKASDVSVAKEVKDKSEEEKEINENIKKDAPKKSAEDEKAEREAAEAKQIEIEKNAATGQIQSVWVDHNIFEDGVKGMRIHVKFSINNLQNVPCRAIAYFYFASGEALKDFNKKYNSFDGQVSVGTDFTPGFVDTSYNDLQLFMPYDELHMNKGQHQLKFIIELFGRNKYSITKSGWTEFQYSS
jgi:hypothetical protein